MMTTDTEVLKRGMNWWIEGIIWIFSKVWRAIVVFDLVGTEAGEAVRTSVVCSISMEGRLSG